MTSENKGKNKAAWKRPVGWYGKAIEKATQAKNTKKRLADDAKRNKENK